MPLQAILARSSPARECPISRRTSTSRRVRVAAASLALIVITSLLLSLPAAQAGTFPVLQEQVLTGTTTGIVGAQAADGLRETLSEADVPYNVTSAPSGQNLTVGSQISGAFPAAVSSRDGVYARYRETTPGPVTVTSNPGATNPGCAWASCDSGRISDNVSASSAIGGDTANYSAFSLNVPASSIITSVSLGYEAFDPTGNDHLSMSLSWDGGTSWCPSFATGGLPSTDPNAYTFVTFTACTGHSWSPPDFGASLTVRFVHVALGGLDTIDLDANVVRVTYQPLAYQVALEYDWTGIPIGASYALALTGHVSNHSVSVEVLTPPSSWTPRATIDSTLDQNLTYPLAASEIASGSVAVRFADAQGSSPTPSDLWIDRAAVISIEHAYRLDVLQNVTGVTGADPTLTVQGNISAGGENFDVFVWDFAMSAWTTALSDPFNATDAVHAMSLTADQISNGSVRIEIRDHDPASAVPAALTLDFVGVQTTDVAAPFPWTLVGGVAAGAFVVAGLLVFLLLRRRRSAAEPSMEPPAVIPAATEAPGAKEQPREVPALDVDELEPGHAYLLDGEEPAAELRVLEELTRMGRSGLVITRRSPSELDGLVRLRHTTSLVLGEGPGAIFGLVTDANAYVLVSAIDAFLKKNPVGVVFFDGLGDLAAPDGQPALLEVLRQAIGGVSTGQQILLASAVLGSLDVADSRRLREPFETVRVHVPLAPAPRMTAK